MSRRRLGAMLAAICLVGSLVAPAFAQDTGSEARKERARQAYDRGAHAYEQGEYESAASEFAQADALMENRVALELALESALLADQGRLAMELATRAEARGASGKAHELSEKARERYAARLGRLLVRCAADRPCSARVRSEIVPIGVPKWFDPGPVEVELDAGGRIERRNTLIKPDEIVEIGPQESSAPAPSNAAPVSPMHETANAPAPEKTGGSPAWFWTGVGLSAALGGATILSALDTKKKHDQYQRNEIDADAGRASQTRTNVLFAVTGAALATTGAIGLFFTDWSGTRSGKSTTALVSFSPSSAVFVLESRH